MTIFTGGLISASTLGILFAADEGLRKGVFELEDIQKDLRNKREQLKTAETQKSQVEKELSQARVEQTKAQQDLQIINKSLQAANAKQRETQAKLNQTISRQAQTQAQLQRTQGRLNQVATQYQQARSELQNVYNQRKALQVAVGQLKAEQQRLYAEAKKAIDEAKAAITKRDRELANRQEIIEKRDLKIAQLDKLIQNRNLEITAREQVIATRESRLKELERQQDYLEQEVARLEKYYQSYQDLRLGKLALVRGQVLAGAVIQVKQATAARQAVLQLLGDANQNAIFQLTEPSAKPENTQILRVTPERVEQLIRQISDGREYVVRIFSAGNYVRGEKQIEFFGDAARNILVFAGGEVLASTSADPRSMSSYELRQRLDLLISASQFRARNAGIVESVQVDGTFLRFINQLRQYDQPLEIKAIASEDTYTAGPLRVKLLAIQNGKVIFST
ncbi:NusA domain-containing protein [Nostoc cycadae WK-1]|uniref:NusA domain-containing protein n=1 Tax=Nostoc cycadae WK-1 TaxID=1861711 RepID=A0A2H6LKY0_9NOSO|nr:NusA domain-containing protein [Nostoc cycadae WK-1]